MLLCDQCAEECCGCKTLSGLLHISRLVVSVL